MMRSEPFAYGPEARHRDGYIAPAFGGRWAVQCNVNRGDGLVPSRSA
jgi:hypothetical protein